jgi:cell division protein FtsI/penicillin-binding protein 2
LIQTFLKGTSSVNSELDPFHNTFNQWHQEILKGAHAKISWKHSYDILNKGIEGLPDDLVGAYLTTFRSYQDLNRPLFGRYRYLRKQKGQQLEKHLATAFYPVQNFGYGRSQAYRQAATQGSIFKLIPAYAALVQRYHEMEGKGTSLASLNPLEITDHTHRQGKDLYVGYHANGKPIPRFYKGGRLPRSMHVIGKIDLLKAIETSSNPYFSLLVGDLLTSSNDLIENAKLFSFGSKTGIQLPAEIPGKMPVDLENNRTGLYATAIGQHSLIVTPLQTAVMLSAIANGGKILQPKIVHSTAGKTPQRSFSDIPHFNLGISFPSLKPHLSSLPLVTQYPSIIRSQIFMPAPIRRILLEGMRRVVFRTQEEHLNALSRFYHDYPEAIKDYIELKEELIGKTSTSEMVENVDLDLEQGTNLYNHVWFGGISFQHELAENSRQFTFHDPYGQPELVVVVYLRFGTFGKETAPLAAQMVKKWREIKRKHEK